jgi:hypothetical protein
MHILVLLKAFCVTHKSVLYNLIGFQKKKKNLKIQYILSLKSKNYEIASIKSYSLMPF